jgi:CubicO group peptidase (beta-lactamase class C family)
MNAFPRLVRLWLAVFLWTCAGRALAATGLAVPGLEVFDGAVASIMKDYDCPGAQLAVMKDGRLVYARGYGVADTATGRVVQPTTPFRTNSFAKPLTAMAVLKLVELGRVGLDDKVVNILGLNPTGDVRWKNITLRNLLEHTGGWNTGLFDPMYSSLFVASAMGTSSPPSNATTIAYMAQRQLDFAPGTAVAYSNFGYALLGRVIEKLTGMSYGDYVLALFAPSGIQHMYLASSRPKDRPPSEANYYSFPGDTLHTSVFSDTPGLVPYPDGGFAMEIQDADGGWAMSAIDSLRFLRYVDLKTPGPHLLSATTVANMLTMPAVASLNPATGFYVKSGWFVRPDLNGDAEWSHSGSTPGSTTYIVRATNGVSYAVAFNSRDQTKADEAAMYTRLNLAVQSVQSWPSGDLFPQYTSPTNYGGLWWNAPAGSESGWGINLSHQGDVIFATWFTYDVTGMARWYSMTASANDTGAFGGTLYKSTGPAFSAEPFDPAHVVLSAVGNASLTFTDANNGTFSYSLDEVNQTKNITRQVFATLPQCIFGGTQELTSATNYQDLWWNAPAGSESGWGINLAHESNTIFATWFTYAADHSATWYSGTGLKATSGNSFSGTLYSTAGPVFSARPFDNTGVTTSPVGTMALSFSDGDTGTFTYSVNGVSQSKNITRQILRSPGTVCD